MRGSRRKEGEQERKSIGGGDLNVLVNILISYDILFCGGTTTNLANFCISNESMASLNNLALGFFFNSLNFFYYIINFSSGCINSCSITEFYCLYLDSVLGSPYKVS